MKKGRATASRGTWRKRKVYEGGRGRYMKKGRATASRGTWRKRKVYEEGQSDG